ncbi:MAG: Uma2 family endonuclease [Myxococcaceae bacterium]
MKPTRTRAPTYDDIVALPEHLVGEIIEGELVVTPRPAGPHSFAASNLGYELIGPFQRGRSGPGGWWIFSEPELHLRRDVLVPDLAGWRQSRMAVPPAGSHFSLAPDWVCEVLSPSTVAVDRTKKLRLYAREKVKHAWLLAPIAKTLEVLRLEGKRWVLVTTFARSERARAEPFEEHELRLDDLWLPELHQPAKAKRPPKRVRSGGRLRPA